MASLKRSFSSSELDNEIIEAIEKVNIVKGEFEKGMSSINVKAGDLIEVKNMDWPQDAEALRDMCRPEDAEGSFTEEAQKEILQDFTRCCARDPIGVGTLTALACQAIDKLADEEWKVVCGDAFAFAYVRSFDQLCRLNVRNKTNAHKFLNAAFMTWSPDQKVDYIKANLEARKVARGLPSVSLQILPVAWERIGVSKDPNKDLKSLGFESLNEADFPGVQKYGADGKILEKHSEDTKKGIKLFVEKTGIKVSIDDWSLKNKYCNNTDFVEEMLPYSKEVKVDIVLAIVLFDVKLTEDQSPAFESLNTEACKFLDDAGKTREELRRECLPLWKDWTQKEIYVTLKVLLTQAHVDSWPELKTSQINTNFVTSQDAIMNAKTVLLHAAEKVYLQIYTASRASENMRAKQEPIKKHKSQDPEDTQADLETQEMPLEQETQELQLD